MTMTPPQPAVKPPTGLRPPEPPTPRTAPPQPPRTAITQPRDGVPASTDRQTSVTASRTAGTTGRTTVSAGAQPRTPGRTTTTAPTARQAARDVCCRAVIVAYEALLGHRPLHQLTALVTSEVLAGLEQRAALRGASQRRPREVTVHRVRIRRARCWTVSPVAVEVALAVDVGPRTRAVAARVEVRRACWRVTALALG